MNELHLFSGAGGGILGGILLGHTCVCAVEIEPYCRKVLLQRQRDGILPKFPIWDDVRTFNGGPWRGRVDVVCAGIPCQKVSSAGNGGGFIETDYYSAYLRIVCEVGPKIVFLENSPVLTSRGLGFVLRDLASMGFDAQWGVLGNGDVGPDKVGDRIWIAAKAKPSGWEKLLRCQQRFGAGKSRASCRPTDDVNPQDWTSRLRALEEMVGQPAILGSRDGLAMQVDRLNAIGNGQVPAVVKLAWEILS